MQRFEGKLAGCLVTDIRMPEMDGLELLQALAARGPLPPVIVITGHGEVPLAVQAMKLGARDFIEKPFDTAELMTSIRAALTGDRELGRAWSRIRRLLRRLARLTPREREVLEQLVIGRSNKAIARAAGDQPTHGGDPPRPGHGEDAGREPVAARAHGVCSGHRPDHPLTSRFLLA